MPHLPLCLLLLRHYSVAVYEMEQQLTPDITTFLLYCARGEPVVDPSTASFILKGVVEGVEVRAQDWGALDGKVKPDDLERVITWAKRPTLERLRDVEATAADLRIEVDAIKQQASQMAPAEERKKEVMFRRDNANTDAGMSAYSKSEALRSFLERPWTDHFIGIGMDEDLPRILRFTGKIRNKAFTKMECEQRVKDIWAAKLGPGGSAQSMDKFMYDFIKERTPVGLGHPSPLLPPSEYKQTTTYNQRCTRSS